MTFVSVYLSFNYNFIFVIAGIFLWGVVMGIHETIFKAYIVDTVEKNRASAFAIFNTVYGLAILIGSVIIGALYQYKYQFLVTYFIVTQLLAIFFTLRVRHKN